MKRGIQVGEWWGVGEHRFLCGDLTTGAGEAVIEMAGRIDAVYTDPPWGKGEARRFRTLSGVEQGQSPPVDWPALCDRMVKLWGACSGDVWVAMSPRCLHDLVRSATLGGMLELGRWPALYGDRRCVLLRYRTSPAKPPRNSNRNLHGIEVGRGGATVLHGLQEGATVVDWCFGLGATPAACVEGGWRFVGSELAPDRMRRTLERVAKATGELPRLL